MKVFYCRCSTVEQNESRQMMMAKENGAERVFLDKASGKNMERPQLKEMLGFIREGDIVVTESVSRIARNTRDLLSIIDELRRRRVEFISLKEQIDTSSPHGQFMLTVFAALAEFERNCILQRQAEGIAIAKSKHMYSGRKPMVIDEEKFIAFCREWRRGERTAASIQKEFGITSTTFYRWVNLRFSL